MRRTTLLCRTTLMMALFVFTCVPAGWAQQEAEQETQPESAEDQPAAEKKSDEGESDESKAFDAKSFFQETYQLTRAAKTEQEFDAIITRCQDGLTEELSDRYIAYARRLLAWSHNKRGELRDAANRSEEAIGDFEHALIYSANDDARRYVYHYNRAISYAQSGELEKAMADLNASIRMNGRFAKSRFNRGEINYVRENYSDAIRDYTAAIRLQPNEARNYNSRGHAYYRRNNYSSAVRDYTRAIQLDERLTEAFVNRADAYGDLGYFDRALIDYRTALELSPDSAWAHRGAAWLMATCPVERYRSEDQAIRAADRAVRLFGEEDPLFLDTQAAAYANAGDYEKAQQLQSRAIELASDASSTAPQAYQDRLSLYKESRPYRDVLRRP